MVKKSRNPEKSQKLTKKKKSFGKIFITEKYPILLVFQYQEDAILTELSSPARFRNTKISKNPFFYIFLPKKKLSSQFSNITRTRFKQSSPVQPVSESRGGLLSVMDKIRRTEILMCNFGCTVHCGTNIIFWMNEYPNIFVTIDIGQTNI